MKNIFIFILLGLFVGCSTLGPNQTTTIYSARIHVKAANDQPITINAGFTPVDPITLTAVELGTKVTSVRELDSKGCGVNIVRNGRVVNDTIQLIGDYSFDGSDNSSAHRLFLNMNEEGSWLDSSFSSDGETTLPPWDIKLK